MTGHSSHETQLLSAGIHLLETRSLSLASDLIMALEGSGHRWLTFGAAQLMLCGQPPVSPNANWDLCGSLINARLLRAGVHYDIGLKKSFIFCIKNFPFDLENNIMMLKIIVFGW